MIGGPGELAGTRMYESTHDARWMHGIDLAQEADFDLGSLHVRPATCRVEFAGVSQGLQRRVMQVLVALAQARGSVVSQNNLVARCWRGLSVSDDAIYRCISKLRKLAAEYPDPPFAIEAIPGIGYRLTSPDVAQDGPAIEPAAPLERRPHFRAWVIASVLLVLAIAGAALWTSRDRVPDRPPLRVAVQPFEALTASADARVLARRIPNQIVDALGDSQIEAALSGERAVDQAIGSANSVPGLIVTGLLRDDGRNTVVDVRLENGTTRSAIWSTEFRRDSRHASDLPLEVAARIADVVSMVGFARNANPPLTDDSALTPLLQTTEMIRDSREGAWAAMIEKSQSVVARYADFAFGHSNLAEAYAEAARQVDIPGRSQAMTDAARREANLTLKLDPADAGAYAVLSEIEPTYSYRTTEDILLRGMKVATHPREPLGALYSYEAYLLSNVGRMREALSYQLIAHATDPWGAPKTAKLAFAYANVGNLPLAREWLQQATQRWPNHSGVRNAERYVAGFYDTPAEGLETIDAMELQTSPEENQTAVWRAFIDAKAAHAAPLTAAAIGRIREAADQRKISRDTEIMMIAALGQPKLAIEVANNALDHEQFEAWFLFAPATRNMRQDPGFIGLADRMGLIEYWRETGKRPDYCVDPATRSDCSRLEAAIQTSEVKR